MRVQEAGDGAAPPLGLEWRPAWLGVLLGVVCVCTTAGNLLVVIAVCTKRQLRTPTGLVVISLAAADLIVGVCVMPLNSLFEMHRRKWLFGLAMCDFFHSADILASTASIWSLCVIALDRYIAGRDPLRYREKVSRRRMLAAVFAVWFFSALLSLPAPGWWRYTSPHLYSDPERCEFTDDWSYVLISSAISFYIPLALILFAYAKVFVIASRHSRHIHRGFTKVKPSHLTEKRTENGAGMSRIEDSKPDESTTLLEAAPPPMRERQHSTLRIHFGGAQRDSQRRKHSPAHSSDGHADGRSGGRRQLVDASQSPRHGHEDPHRSSSSSSSSPWGCARCFDSVRKLCRTPSVVSVKSAATIRSATSSSSSSKRKRYHLLLRHLQLSRELRAARTLSIVVGVFVLSWLPFFVASPLLAVARRLGYQPLSIGVETALFTVLTWLGHLNSTLNPLIYSRFSRDFRRAFQQILTCSSSRDEQRRPATGIQRPLQLVFSQVVGVAQMADSASSLTPRRAPTVPPSSAAL